MLGKNTLFSYYHKSAYVTRIARYVVTFLFILFLLSCIFIFSEDITAENIQLLTKYITINEGSYSNYTDEFSISAGENSEIITVSDNIAVVKNNNLSLYDLGGQKLFSFDYSFSLPSSKTDNRNLIVYDIGGKELSIFNTFSKIKTLNFNNGIYFADISDKGIVAVSKEESYRSALTVFNNNYKDVYKWLSSENYITHATLSHDGKNVLVVTADSNDASYSCSVLILDITSSSTKPKFSHSISGELPVCAGYSEDKSSIYVITDSNIYFYDSELKPKSTYKFNQSKIENYYISNNTIILTERSNISGNAMLLVGLSTSGDKLFDLNVLDEITDIAIGTNKFFALGKRNVFEFSNDNNGYKQTHHQELNTKFNSIICDSDNNCYITSNSTVKKVIFNDEKDIEQK